ncbi:MAG: DEAD/DEAH box helicase [Methanothrix sp.]|uniref:DEAD/DEAH box helicase domain protein n=1 Tax=Methanothrix thermoacetophila (strain DSM 6194 / JCM 14653 / NBRC 101360 / PT) TaxID=349307 RepID=A0B5Q2_METTP|nr:MULTISPECIES: DEAD/DEAH box helicase [Methanothrix]ABK14026.1 DEAD/DEAH box helicase domain protein [Methanothrix thermoacetophila PT]MBC7079798.1 DEAD/DEAH box helicase [Methanothrix sp.]NPU87948.1 DEAD/DEAH box helicase [Methanothrix sp.]
MSYLVHPLLKPEAVEKRLFQIDLAARALRGSTLVVMPTGLGKTIVALMVMLARLEKGRVLFLAPTRPLVEQHAAFLRRVLTSPDLVASVTGETDPESRAEIWRSCRIAVSTPQVVENDLLSGRMDLRDVSLVIFDEAHRAAGNYAYVYIAERYRREARDPLVLGMTASPGSEAERIAEICANLGIESIEMKSESDPDVAPFVHHREIEWIKVEVPEQLQKIRGVIDGLVSERMEEINSLGMCRIDPRTSKGELLDLQKRFSSALARGPNQNIFRGISLLAEIMKLKHAVELAETQGVSALRQYLERLAQEARSRGGSKASRRLIEDPRIQHVLSVLKDIDLEHPKLSRALEIIEDQLETSPESRIIVFTNYRDTATALLRFLQANASDAVKPVRFVGQASRENDEGLSQRKQSEILEKFRAGEYNVLIATSVGEEGIDIPSTDMVLFYEPVPSEIRSIQRKGRTGRARTGRVVVLIAKGTRDEAYYWISDRKERTMRRQLQGMAEPLPVDSAVPDTAPISSRASRQISITEICEPDELPLIIVDSRERDMARLLEKTGLRIVLRSLEVGDYVLSERLGIERKTADDLIDSIIDPERDLFRQIGDLARTYDRPLLIIEGQNLYARQVHPNSVRGILATIAVDFGVPIVPTGSIEETAALIALMARREHEAGYRDVKLHGRKTSRTLKEQQEYLISALPGVGPSVARNLLRHFGSVERIMTASEGELMSVDKVGPKTAARIREIVSGEYKG